MVEMVLIVANFIIIKTVIMVAYDIMVVMVVIVRITIW